MSLPTRLARALAASHARYDGAALQPPAWASVADEAARAAVDPAAWQQLLAWCRPRATQRAITPWRHAAAGDFAIATLDIAGTVDPGGAGPDLRRWAQALARHVDGSSHLATLSPLAGMGWRLAILAREVLAEALPARGRPPGDPWDAGWASVAPSAQRRLESGFQLRRPTLILALGEDSRTLTRPLAALAQRSDDLRHPLRWLWVGEPATALPARLAATLQVRVDLAAPAR